MFVDSKAHSKDLSTYLSPPTIAPSTSPDSPLPPLDPPILELHGTLRHAHCLSCHAPTGRDAFQDRLSALNPEWASYSDSLQLGTTREEKLNPDGDIELGPNIRYEDFLVPECSSCGEKLMKPRVTFFGESLEPIIRRQSERLIKEADRVLVVGSSLATFSAFRLVRQAKEEGKEVGLINLGKTRGDGIVDWRIGCQEWTGLADTTEGGGGAGPVLTGVVQELVKGMQEGEKRKEVEEMLRSGKIKPLPKSMRAAS